MDSPGPQGLTRSLTAQDLRRSIPGNGHSANNKLDLHASSGTGYRGRTRRLDAEQMSADLKHRVSHTSKAKRRTKVATYQIQDEGFHWQGVDG